MMIGTAFRGTTQHSYSPFFNKESTIPGRFDDRDVFFECLETINKTMASLIDVLSNINILEQKASASSILDSPDQAEYGSIDRAVKSYLTEANRLIATLLSFHPKVSGAERTSTGWRDENAFKESDYERMRKASRSNPDLELAIGFLREIGSLLSLHAKVLHHLKTDT